jgi:hypothetical protein
MDRGTRNSRVRYPGDWFWEWLYEIEKQHAREPHPDGFEIYWKWFRNKIEYEKEWKQFWKHQIMWTVLETMGPLEIEEPGIPDCYTPSPTGWQYDDWMEPILESREFRRPF